MSFKSSKDGVQLNGTLLTVAQPKATVLLIVGSGKTDRDATSEKTHTFSGKKEKIFKQLAEALAEAGYSSFRYDKRGVLDETGKINKTIWAKADLEHLLADAIDASRFLIDDHSVKISDLIILGHSEGSTLALETAISLNQELRGLVLLGAMARSFKELLYYQIVESPQATSSGQNKNAIDDYQMALKMIEHTKDEWAPDNKPMNWYRQLLKAPTNESRISLVKAPIAIFQGNEDFTIPITEVQKFKQLGLKNMTTKTYPGLGHAFSPNKNGQATYGPIEQNVVNDIISTINRF